MTCGSDRSGRASSGVLRTESSAQTASPNTMPKTTHLWRTESSMMRSTIALLPMSGVRVDRLLLRSRRPMVVAARAPGGSEPAFRIEQEHAGCHDLFALGET